MTTLNAAQIQGALQKLDVNNDNHWTSDGLPRLDTVKMIAGDQSLTRDVVTQAAPGFTRAVATQGAAPIAPPAPPAAATDTAAPPPEGAGATPPPPAPPPPAPAPDTEPKVEPVSTTAQAGLPSHGSIVAAALNTPPVQAEDIEALKERLEVVQDELTQIARAEVEIKKEKEKRKLEADDLIVRIDRATPKSDNQQAIMDYLASQQRKLQGRADQIGRIKQVENELGVRLSDLVPKRSPLDTAMARKTGYGRNRPGG
jgi:hypothetical protein